MGVWSGLRVVSFVLYRLIGAKPKDGKISSWLCSVCATESYLGGRTIKVLVTFSVRVRHDGTAASGKGLSSAASCMTVSLHYADIGMSVKEMYRFRQIRRAGFVQDGRIKALQPGALLRVVAAQDVCAFSEP